MKLRGTLDIDNTSAWPHFFVQTVCTWIWSRLDRRDRFATGYRFTVRDATEQYDCRGRGGRIKAFIRLGRRCKQFKYLQRDSRFTWAPEYPLNGILEAFVFIAAHEMRHGHAENYALWSTGRRQGGEHDANHWAHQTVLAFRAEWPAIRAGMLQAHRLQRQRERELQARLVAKRAEKSAPETKLARVIELKKGWLTKQKRAATWIKKLNRRESALRRVIDQRQAAKG